MSNIYPNLGFGGGQRPFTLADIIGGLQGAVSTTGSVSTNATVVNVFSPTLDYIVGNDSLSSTEAAGSTNSYNRAAWGASSWLG